MRVGKLFSFAVLCLVLASGMTVRAETHPFSIHDMLAMERISDPQVSSSGRIVYSLRTTDLEANKGRRDLWLIEADGSGLRQLTSGDSSESNPRWSPDGKTVYFLSGRSGTSQIWQIPVDGGEARKLTDFPLDLTSFNLSGDGKAIAFSADVFVNCESEPLACTAKRLEEKAADPTTGMIYDRLFVRHWDTWKDGRRSHLFVMSVDGGAAVDVMKGMDADCPTKPFGGAEEYTFAPDGDSVLLTARDVGREEAWSTDFDLYVTKADGSRPPLCLTGPNPAWDTAPLFSPDGKTLAYLAMARAGYESDRYRVVLMDWPEGKPRVLTEKWDRSPSGIAWSEDGKALYAKANHLGQRALFSIDAKNGKVRPIIEEGTVRSIAVHGGRIIYGLDHLRSPVELYSVKPDGSDIRRITHVNDARIAAARMGEPEQFTFKGWNDETVHAYVVKPVDFEAGKKYPVAFLIHGGPQGSFGNDFHYRWNPQAYTGAGYAAVMVDFHGSVGYGQAFTDSIGGDWGGKPLVDLQKGLAAALERYPFLDGERVAALGASYGGYMINWISGNWSDRFRALVNHDGNLDEQMAYYDTEELWFPEWERGGAKPWENPEAYQKHNPINHVKNWKTPMLVIHGALDYRVVDVQGLATFTALQRKGVPSKLLYFPDENHWVLKPQNSVLWHDTVIDWIDWWTKPDKPRR